MTATTESILLSFQNTTTLKVLVLSLNREVDVGVDHMLKLITTGHLSVLGHLADDEYIDSVFFCIGSK